jgi:hypothetical protein
MGRKQQELWGCAASVGILAVTLGWGAFSEMSAQSPQVVTATSTNLENRNMNEETPFYCNLKALSQTEHDRQKRIAEKLAEARLETKELADGYAFRLDSEKASLADLAEWIANERKCCPFFSFEIELDRENGPLWLRLRGRKGVKAFIRSEFGIA